MHKIWAQLWPLAPKRSARLASGVSWFYAGGRRRRRILSFLLFFPFVNGGETGEPLPPGGPAPLYVRIKRGNVRRVVRIGRLPTSGFRVQYFHIQV